MKKKKAKVLPSDNNSPNRTDYRGEIEPCEKKKKKKKRKVLPSDNNSPNRIEYPRERTPASMLTLSQRSDQSEILVSWHNLILVLS